MLNKNISSRNINLWTFNFLKFFKIKPYLLIEKSLFRDLGLTPRLTAKRYNHDLSTLMLDIDKFKKINDVYGHKTGDMVIVEIANQMQIHSRDSDSIFRYGGE